MTERRSTVGDLEVGHVVVMGYDPDRRQLHWIRGTYNVEAHLVLVDCTVVHSEADPYDEHPHTLRLMHDGRRWTIHPRPSVFVTVLGEHHERCGSCGELWPCREERLDQEAREFTRELDDQCAHCGLRIGSAWSVSFHDGVQRRKFHLAKKYRARGKACREAADEAQAAIPGQATA